MVERLMGKKQELRFPCIQESARFVGELDVVGLAFKLMSSGNLYLDCAIPT
jgi:hypothetical protein